MSFFRRLKDALNPRKEEVEDPVFGHLIREGKGMWVGEFPFAHPPSRTNGLSLLIDSGEGQPTEEQRRWFAEILIRFESLWPIAADALAERHPELASRFEVERHVDFTGISLSPVDGSRPPGWSLDCAFDCDADMSYSAEFVGWHLIGVSAGD